MPIRRILVPVDFSPESLRAAGIAHDIAEQTGARLRFLTVLDVGDLRAALHAQLSGFRTDEEVHLQLQRWIRRQYSAIDMRGATRTVRRGIAEKEIVAAIEGYRPDLVIMGSSGLMRRLPVGSTTEYVLRHSPVSVLVVKPPART